MSNKKVPHPAKTPGVPLFKEMSLVYDPEHEGESQTCTHTLRVSKAVEMSWFSSIDHWVINYWIDVYCCSDCE